MTYNYTKALVLAILLGTALPGFSQKADVKTSLERQALQAVAQQQATVQISTTLQKAQTMRDLMCRPLRGCKDQVVRYITKTRQCQGILAQGTNRVYVPASCVEKEGFRLTSMQLVFANGRKAVGTQHLVNVVDDIAFIPVEQSLIQGLRGLPVNSIPRGKTLRETFGNKIENFLLSFFHSRGVNDGQRYWALRHPGSKVNVKIGEPVVYQGKVVALVREVPHMFHRGFWGNVSEEPLALIRS